MANWIVMPVVNGLEMTRQAICDCLDQTGVDPHVLVVLQGADREIRETLEGWAEREPRLLVWSHDPPLPSLSATWNRALRFVWEARGTECLVVNNDVRLDPWTYLRLLTCLPDHLFVTAVGWDERRWMSTMYTERAEAVNGTQLAASKGGPDFSCFLISKACHAQYPFDEAFIPAYCEDLDYHRRLMLGGDGARIFSVNLPYLHYASQTVAQMSPEARAAWAARSGASRAHYRRKWGGDVNEEQFMRPFDPTSARAGYAHTPELQRRVLAGEAIGGTVAVAGTPEPADVTEGAPI